MRKENEIRKQRRNMETSPITTEMNSEIIILILMEQANRIRYNK